MSKTITGIVDWLKDWFYTKDEIDAILNADNGWQGVTYSSGYTDYSSTYKVQVRKNGKMVEVRGIWKPTASKTTSTTQVKFATLPSGYAPPSSIFTPQRCNGQNSYLLGITSDGELTYGRYGVNNGTNATIASGAIMRVYLMYLID